MHVTFRVRRSLSNLLVWFLPLFLAFTGLGLFGASRAPDLSRWLALAGLTAGAPLFMAGLTIWTLVAYQREQLTIRNDQVAFRGVFTHKEICLRDVTDARWSTLGSKLALRTDSARCTIEFGKYEYAESEWIAHHIHSVLRPEVQSGWNLFAYKTAFLKPRAASLKPGPDRVLIHRARWNWYFGPSFVLMTAVAIFSWRVTGNFVCLLGLLFPLALWAMARAGTSPNGSLHKKVFSSEDPAANRFLIFLLLWGGVGVVSVLAAGRIRAGTAQPEAFMFVGAAVWLGVLFLEAALEDTRQRRRDREAADLAAKAHGEPGTNPWQQE